VLRGPELFVGYADADMTERVVTKPGRWFRTGDLGVLDADGWLRVTGRLSDIIIRAGENISASEVEATLEAHPSVRHAVAVPVPDPEVGERVAVFVETSAPFDLATCRAWFTERSVTRFKTPEFVFVLDALPVLAAGKPDRAAMRTMAVKLAGRVLKSQAPRRPGGRRLTPSPVGACAVPRRWRNAEERRSPAWDTVQSAEECDLSVQVVGFDATVPRSRLCHDEPPGRGPPPMAWGRMRSPRLSNEFLDLTRSRYRQRAARRFFVARQPGDLTPACGRPAQSLSGVAQVHEQLGVLPPHDVGACFGVEVASRKAVASDSDTESDPSGYRPTSRIPGVGTEKAWTTPGSRLGGGHITQTL